MSKEVDERVVSMQFDNRHFERNVATTMSTLDKLKAKLHLPGASKGLEDVNAAARKVDLSHIGKSAETVGLKFNAMYTIADQALRNITNSAMATAKKMVSAFTIDPIKTGFDEYETKINAIQTIMSNTASKGTTMEDVTRVIDELNTYADKTIYNFAEMTRNIGTFTAAGVGLQESADAIQGIANLAAASGSNSQQASTAMYQLSQALAAGTVKLMDWNSVVNAGMGGEKFQEALKSTAREMGISVDSMIEKHGSFRESLSEGWITAEVLNTTLKKFTKEGAAQYAEAMVKSGKYTQEQADALIKEAQSMEDAATKVKTFTQLIDTLKESVQSGWGKTWELIIGNFEQAKELFSGISDTLSGFIDRFSDARNAVLESALGKSFKSLLEPLKGIKQTVETISEPIKTVTKSLEDYNAVVKEVINGDWGVTEKRWNALAEAGYDWATVQNMVNEELGCSVRHNTDFVIGQSEATKSTEQATETNTKYIATLAKKSDEELRSLGLSEQQITAIKEIRKQADKLGLSVEDFVNNIDKLDGRWVMLNSFKNAAKALGKVFSTVAQAWKEIFPPKSTEEKANALYDLLAAFHKFTTKLTMTDKTADKLKRTLKGVFAILDIITSITGGAFKIAFKAVNTILGAFNLNILDVTAVIGDAIVAVRDWIKEHNLLTKGIEVIVPYLKKAAKGIKDWVDGLKEADNIPKYIIQGLINGLTGGAKAIYETVINLGKIIIDTIKGVLGIHSPSTVFFEIGENIIQGLANGLKEGASLVWNLIKTIGTKCIEIVNDIDLGKILSAGIGFGITLSIIKIADAVKSIGSALEGFGDMFEGVGSMLEDFGIGVKSFLKGAGLEMKSKAILNMAKAIAILVGSIFVLTKIDTGELWGAIGALAALAGILVALSYAATKMGEIKNIGTQSLALLGIAGSLLILAIVLKKLASIDGDDIPKVIFTLTVMIAGLGAILATFGKLGYNKAAENINKVGVMMLKISVALLIMTFVIKQISKLDDSAIKKGLGVIAALELFVMGFIWISKYSGEHASKAGSMLMRIAIALGILVYVIDKASQLDDAAIEKGIGVIGSLELLMIALIGVSKLAGQHAAKAGTMLLLMSLSFGIMIRVIKQASELDGFALDKGLGAIAAIGTVFAALIAVSRLAGNNAVKAGAMLLMMSGAILILTGVMFLLSLLDPSDMGRALAAIVVLEACFAGLIAVTKLAKATKGMKSTLITLTACIAVLAGIVIALSFLDPSDLAVATGALTAMTGIFGGLIYVTKLAKNTKSMRKTLLELLAVVAVLALILAGLSLLNPESLLASSAALSVLLMSFSTSMAVLGKAGKISTTVSKNIYPMLGIVAGLAAILGILAALNVEPSLESAIALGTLLNAMATAMVILSKAGKVSNKAIGALALMGLVVAEVAIVLGVMSKFNVEPSIETATALSTLLLGMSGALVILGYVGTLGPAAFIGIGALATLIAGIGGLLIAIGALVKTFPQLEEFLNVGIPIMEKIGYAIGSFFGNIVGGFLGGMSSGLPEIGANLSAFIINAMPFIAGVKMVDESVLEGAARLVEIIILISAAQIIEGIASFLTGGSSMESFGQKLLEFGNYMVQFSNIITGNVNAEAVTSVANAGKILAELANTLPKSGGVAQFFTGETMSMEEFGKQLIPFGKAMAEFSKTVSGEGAVNPEAIESAANAGKVMSEMANSLPKENGVAQFFAGTPMSMEEFGNQLKPFGKAMVEFSSIVGAEGAINSEAVTAAANAGKMMSEMANTLPNSGGVFEFFTGKKMSMEEFGNQLIPFGKAMVDFSSIVGGEGTINPEAITSVANAGKMMSEMANTLPNSGGIIEFFTGSKMTMSEFGTEIKSFGKAMVEFSSTVSGEGAINSEAITATANAGDIMLELANSLPETGGIFEFFTGSKMTMSEFGTEIKAFGKGIAGFSETVSGKIDSSSVEAAASAGKLLVEICNSLPDTGGLKSLFSGSKSMDNFGKELKVFGAGLAGFASQVENVNTYKIEQGSVAGKALVDLCNTIGNGVTVFSNMLDVATFGPKIVAFGQCTKQFSDAVVGVDRDNVINGAVSGERLVGMANRITTDKKDVDIAVLGGKIASFGHSIKTFGVAVAGIDLTSINNGVEAGLSIIDLINKVPKGTVNLLVCGSQLVQFGKYMAEFSNSVSGIDAASLNGTVSQFKLMIDSIKRITVTGINEISSSLDSAGKKISTSINTMLTSSIKTISHKEITFSNAGKSLVDKFSSAISDNASTVSKKCSTMIDTALSSVKNENNYSKFYDAGFYLVKGFKNGIDENTWMAEAKAKAMALAAKRAAEKALGIESPSKVFYKIGAFTCQGFINALTAYSAKTYNASTDMADNATSGFSRAISRIKDMVENGVDAQPTIRPVVDLSDVSAGVGSINRMFDLNPSFGVISNVRGIASMMNERQNGVDSDLTSAIKDLKNSLRESSGDVYNINGVTYDDGSNVADAVKSIVRAARIERRM